MNHKARSFVLFPYKGTSLGSGLYFVLNTWNSLPYIMIMTPLSRNDQFIKSTHIL